VIFEIGVAAALAVILGWAAWIDLKQMILPDWITLPLIPAGLALAWVQERPLIERVIGAVAGYAAFAGIAWIYRRWRDRDGLGLGDAKLLAAAGAWTGWASLPSVVLVGSVTALAWVLVARPDPQKPFPFGPFLALGFWLVWKFGPLTLG
jgi:leader peptidase (prepilin peptidase)/N-methyltransferase